MSTRGGKPGKGRGGKKGGFSKGVYVSKRPVGGAGIFVTCVRGKEGAAVGQMYDLLEEVAARHWPPERLAKFEEQRLQKKAALAKAAEEAGTTAPAPAPEAMEVESNLEEGEESDEDESIEASIARELADLKAAKTVRKRKAGEAGIDGEKGKEKGDKPKPRFLSLETGAECLLFFALAWPYDPVEMTHAIVTDLLANEVSRTKYVMRLEPASNSCSALNLDMIPTMSTGIISKAFHEYAAQHQTTKITYSIDTQIRNHTHPLSRDVLIETLGTCVRSLSTPSAVPIASSSSRTSAPDPTTTNTQPLASDLPPATLPALEVSANLKSPDLLIIATVLKNSFGLGVVDGKLWMGKGRKFNLEQVALSMKMDEVEKEGKTQVRGMETEEKKDIEVAKIVMQS